MKHLTLHEEFSPKIEEKGPKDHFFSGYDKDQAKKDLVKARDEKKIRWTDKEGHSYSVIAKDFITANALYLALGKSPLVRKAEFIPLD